MDLLNDFPSLDKNSKSEQAREIFLLLSNAEKNNKSYTWFQTPSGVKLHPEVKIMLEQKNYIVKEHVMFDVTWVDNKPIRSTIPRIKYYIGDPMRKND